MSSDNLHGDISASQYKSYIATRESTRSTLTAQRTIKIRYEAMQHGREVLVTHSVLTSRLLRVQDWCKHLMTRRARTEDDSTPAEDAIVLAQIWGKGEKRKTIGKSRKDQQSARR